MNAMQPQLCACGSGLRPPRCCQLDLRTLGPASANRHLLPLVDQAIASHTAGRFAEAEKLCLDVLELAPGQGGALAVLYQIRKAQGAYPAAEALIRRLVAIDPNNVWATQELALLLFGRGNLGDAEAFARNAIRIAPADPQSHNLMGMIMTEVNRPQVGEFHYRRALELLGSRQPILLANLAWLAHGGSGFVSVVGHAAGDQLKAMADAFFAGDHAEALTIFTRMLPAIDAVMGVANYGATTAKAALQLLGVLDNRNVRAPLVALDDDEVAALRAGLDAAGLLQGS